MYSQSIVSTVHNLSAAGPGSVRAATESEVCLFCHTPHSTSPKAPLWNRQDPGETYTLYTSSTLQAAIGQPTGSAILCLSCHDGSIALGNVLSRTSPIAFLGSVSVLPPGNANLQTDLSDDHPVSFIYTTGLAVTDGQLKDPLLLSGQVQLESGAIQCITCHDPHVNIYTDFLVQTNQESLLCMECHDITNWGTCIHKLSGKPWNHTGPDPWPHTPYTTMRSNGCENCHAPHAAGGSQRLLNHTADETNCLVCHNGNVATTDIETMLTRTYTHNVAGYTSIHDLTESALVSTQHVECVDCHNPHQLNRMSRPAPSVRGALRGARGIDTNGNAVDPAYNEYEVCYRCHADSPSKPGNATARQLSQNNVRLEFDPGSVSYHPVETIGQNPTVPSLVAPYTTGSIIYCTNCHASNGTSSATNGPHGSIYAHILRYKNETADFTVESPANYELCYSCHARTVIISSTGPVPSQVHYKHVVEENTPCNACHDPHGIASSQGSAANNSNLINFDISIVQEYNGQRLFQDLGSYQGQCTLSCHGTDHPPKSYP